uniref:Uncharacterized protein n=2 Tax=Zooxanthella nutricula TaxID=1333877 RepID=A0A7S2JMP0_9DINO
MRRPSLGLTWILFVAGPASAAARIDGKTEEAIAGSDEFVAKVDFVVYDELGPPAAAGGRDEDQKQKLDAAKRWIFVALVKSIFDNDHARDVHNSETTINNFTGSATGSWQVLGPFDAIDDLPQDPRSLFRRTRFSYAFHDEDRTVATEMLLRICNDFAGTRQELVVGVVRALDLSDLYPHEALTRLGTSLALGYKAPDLRALIHISAAIFQGGVRVDSLCSHMGEHADMADTANMFVLPPCPENSAHCDKTEDVECNAHETSTPGFCKCVFGYQGSIVLPVWEDPTAYRGDCELMEPYCESSISQPGGGRLTAVLDQEVEPVCPAGFRPSGTSKCVAFKHEHGNFLGEPFCRVAPPARPPVGMCPLPDVEKYFFDEAACAMCMPGEACACTLSCHTGSKDFRRQDEMQDLACISRAFECPDAVRWEHGPRRCVDRSNDLETMLFCCEEPWLEIDGIGDLLLPPVSFQAAICSTIDDPLQCYQSAEGHDRCCWEQSGWPMSGDNPMRCARESELEGLPVDAPIQCAILREVPVAVWAGEPDCRTRRRYPEPIEGIEFRNVGDHWFDDEVFTGEVWCTEGTHVHLGGGSVGLRNFSGDPPLLQGELPLCAPAPLPPRCGDVPNAPVHVFREKHFPSLRIKGTCRDCRAGDSSCDCDVTCADGFVLDAGFEGRKWCNWDVAPLETVTDCRTATRTECLARAQAGQGPGPASPCCLLNDFSCEAMGSPRITRNATAALDRPLEICAQAAPQWDPMPQCVSKHSKELERTSCRWKETMSVPSAIRKRVQDALSHVSISPGCGACIPGLECPDCKVHCKPGSERFGGGHEGGGWRCNDVDRFFQPLPLCWTREPAPRCRERAPASGLPGLWPHAQHALRNCEDCPLGSGCCAAECADGYASGPHEAEAGEPTHVECVEERAKLNPVAKCASLRNEGDCLRSEQVGRGMAASATAAPCCWHSAPVEWCVPARSALLSISQQPDVDAATGAFKCARTRSAAYLGFPTCEPKCLLDPEAHGFDVNTAAQCNGQVARHVGFYQVVEGGVQVRAKHPSAVAEGSSHIAGLDPGTRVKVINHWISPDYSSLWGEIDGSGWIQLVSQDQNGVHVLADRVGDHRELYPCIATCGPSHKNAIELPMEGPKACRLDYQRNRPVWQDLPRCQPVCQTPSDDEGTRKIVGCRGCFEGEGGPGSKCECTVTCSDGQLAVSGEEGPQTCTRRPDGQPPTFNPPKCVPFCAPPDDQMGNLVIHHCRNPCIAHDGRPPPDYKCDCNLKCAAHWLKKQEGPHPPKDMTKFECRKVIKRGVAVGMWAVVDADERDGFGIWACAKAFSLTVVDSHTREFLEGARVEIFDGTKMDAHHLLKDAYTKRGKVYFEQFFVYMTVRVTKQGYLKDIRVIDIQRSCVNKHNCRIAIGLQKEAMSDGTVQVDNGECYLYTDTPGKHVLTATLTWNQNGEKGKENSNIDMDIWARSWSCGADVEKRYNCGKDKSFPVRAKGDLPAPECRRSDFHDLVDENGWGVRTSEARACKMSTVRLETPLQGWIGTHKCIPEANGRPEIKKVAENQFPKWVHPLVQYMTNLDRRLNGKSPYAGAQDKKEQRAEDFAHPDLEVMAMPEREGYMLLDPISSAYGPETVTFRDVPPGRYQIAVRSYLQAGKMDMPGPRVRISIGNNGLFSCQMTPTCRRQQQVWNVANIVLDDGEPYGNRTRYRIKILDMQDTMVPLTQASLPTNPNTRELGTRPNTVKRLFGFGHSTPYKFRWWQSDAPWKEGPDGPTDQALAADACLGICEPLFDGQADGNAGDLSACLPRNFLVRQGSSFDLPELTADHIAAVSAKGWYGNSWAIDFVDSHGKTLYSWEWLEGAKKFHSHGSRGKNDDKLVIKSHGELLEVIKMKSIEDPAKILSSGRPFEVIFEFQLELVQCTMLVNGIAWEVKSHQVAWGNWRQVRLRGDLLEGRVESALGLGRLNNELKASDLYKRCHTPCATSECTGFNGNVRCWAGSSSSAVGGYTADASKCFTKHTQTSDGWCWDAKEVSVGLECCTGAKSTKYSRFASACKPGPDFDTVEVGAPHWETLRVLCDKSARCAGYMPTIDDRGKFLKRGWLYYGNGRMFGANTEANSLDACWIKERPRALDV